MIFHSFFCHFKRKKKRFAKIPAVLCLCAAPLLFWDAGKAATTQLTIVENKNLEAVNPQIVTLSATQPLKARLAASKETPAIKVAHWGTFTLAQRPYFVAFVNTEKAVTKTAATFWFDHNGDGLLDKQAKLLTAPELNPTPQNNPEGQVMMRSEPINFQLPGALAVPYQAVIEVQQGTQWTLDGVTAQWQAKLYSCARRQGRLNFNGRALPVSLQDRNSNGRFDDTFHDTPTRSAINPSIEEADQLSCDWNNDGDFNDADESSPFGHLLFWNGSLAAVSIAPGGASIGLELYKGATGTLEVETDITEILLTSAHGFLRLEPRRGKSSLPFGKYRFLGWTARRSYQGKPWLLQVKPLKPTLVRLSSVPLKSSLISPLLVTLDAESHYGAVRFIASLTTEKGEAVVKLRGGSTAPPLHLRLSDLQSNPVARLELQPQPDATFTALWKPSFDVPPRLITRLEYDSGPFAMQQTPDLELLVPFDKAP